MITKANKNKIAIAEDVIAQIKARKYSPQTGIYISGGYSNLFDNLTEGDDLQKRVLKLKKGQPCTVCALGSAFLSCVAKEDNYEIDQAEIDYGSIDQDRMREKLEEFFSVEELGVIESCFEVDSSFIADANDDPAEFDNSGSFTEALSGMEDEQRLLFIMQSIVNLDGKVTLDGIKQQLLLAIALDPKFGHLREVINW